VTPEAHVHRLSTAARLAGDDVPDAGVDGVEATTVAELLPI
jgi:hypothetical protein